MLQATWGERPPPGGVDRVVFKPTAEPELLASVMGGHSLLLWSLQGVQEEPEPFALVPAHAQLLTCCDFDAAGTRLLCGDAAGSVLLFTNSNPNPNNNPNPSPITNPNPNPITSPNPNPRFCSSPCRRARRRAAACSTASPPTRARSRSSPSRVPIACLTLTQPSPSPSPSP